ncbi:hypothetical protein BJY04DRAFT_215716 [Aspergillus karnatakaensis]|uniref:uncharacterized protein n=1 Tax=Aspergillus karnatakaensis TaxID=1810916 RepID=UPI003CCD9646
MARFDPEPMLFFALDGKVVVLTGGANGIGASTVSLLYEHGASIVFGDKDATAGTKLSESFAEQERVLFLETDVTSYASTLALFKEALRVHGRIDHAFAIAGVEEQGSWFHPSEGIESVETPPDPLALNVNLLGTLYFARIAAVYLHQNHSDSPEADKSIVLVSSVAGLTESPGLPVYCASKHGIIGLMRSLRTSLPTTHKISVSAVCPWMTSTAMVNDLAGAWQRAGLPVNQAGDVARIIAGLAALGEEGNGKAVYVEGGRGWDVEVGIDESRERWMGGAASRAWEEGQRFLKGNPGSAAYWVQKRDE